MIPLPCIYNADGIEFNVLPVSIGSILKVEPEVLRVNVSMVCSLRYEEIYATRAGIEEPEILCIISAPIGFEPELDGSFLA